MSFRLEPTGEFSASGELNPKTRQFDVRYRLVTDLNTDMGTAWGIAWNQINLRYGTFRECRLKSVQMDGKAETVGQVFDMTAVYRFETEEEDPWFASLSFSTRGGREKKLHSWATAAFPGFGVTQAPPDFQHGIGFNNGVFEGVDVVTPQFGFSLDADLPSTLFSDVQIAFMHRLTGRTNFEPLWIFQQGEVLFTGMTGNSYRRKNKLGTFELWFKVSFEFEAMPSLTDVTIPPFRNITKQGMDYLWVFHQEHKDETSGITIPVPVACYVEKVYPYGDFSWFTQLRW